jgi:putative phage-type endonuclease
MKIVKDSDLKQGGEAWLSARKKGIGSSEIATIIGLNPYKNVQDLWLEKTGKVEPEDISKKFAIVRGQTLEPIARDLFNSETNKNFQPVTFEHEEFPYLKASADGYDFDTNEILEIKCCGNKNHFKMVNENKILDYYLPQVMWLLMISKSSKAYLMAYNPSVPNPYHVIEALPDQEYFDFMLEAAHKFWEHVQQDIRPDW